MTNKAGLEVSNPSNSTGLDADRKAALDAELYEVKRLIEAYALGIDADGLSKAIGQLDRVRASLQTPRVDK